MELDLPNWQIAAIFAFFSAVTFPLGALFGVIFSAFGQPLNKKILGLLLGFGAGALIFAVTVELYAEGLHTFEAKERNTIQVLGLITSIGSAIIGALLFTLLDRQVNKWKGETIQRAREAQRNSQTPARKLRSDILPLTGSEREKALRCGTVGQSRNILLPRLSFHRSGKWSERGCWQRVADVLFCCSREQRQRDQKRSSKSALSSFADPLSPRRKLENEENVLLLSSEDSFDECHSHHPAARRILEETSGNSVTSPSGFSIQKDEDTIKSLALSQEAAMGGTDAVKTPGLTLNGNELAVQSVSQEPNTNAILALPSHLRQTGESSEEGAQWGKESAGGASREDSSQSANGEAEPQFYFCKPQHTEVVPVIKLDGSVEPQSEALTSKVRECSDSIKSPSIDTVSTLRKLEDGNREAPKNVGQSIDASSADQIGSSMDCEAGKHPGTSFPEKAELQLMGVAMCMWVVQMIDAIPESLLIGFRTVSNHLSWAFILSVCAANFPESLTGGYIMKRGGISTIRILFLWMSVALLTSVIAGLTALIRPIKVETLCITLLANAAQGLAGGAMLALLSASMLPAAFAEGGSMSGVFCVLGFLASVSIRLFLGLLSFPSPSGEEAGLIQSSSSQMPEKQSHNSHA